MGIVLISGLSVMATFGKYDGIFFPIYEITVSFDCFVVQRTPLTGYEIHYMTTSYIFYTVNHRRLQLNFRPHLNYHATLFSQMLLLVLLVKHPYIYTIYIPEILNKIRCIEINPHWTILSIKKYCRMCTNIVEELLYYPALLFVGAAF